MNGRERVLAALNRKEPDRVPTLEWVIDSGVMEKMCGTRSITEFAKLVDLDGVSVSLDSKDTVIDSKHIIDEWGITRAVYDEYPMPVKFPIETEDDLKHFVIPDPNASYRFDKIKNAMKEIGDEKCIIARVKDVFSQPRDLMGFENFLMSFYTDPDLAERLMKMSVDYSCKICENLVDLGIEVIVVGDDIANNNALLINPDMYRKMVLPHFDRLVKKAKRVGLKVIKHSDGDLNAIIDDLIGTGIDCLDPIDERGNMIMSKIKGKYKDVIALKGNVDCVSTLVDKSPEDVRRETARCILNGSVGGGHIISSSNSIHSGVSPVNYKVFLDTIKDLGTYPLKISDLEKAAK